MIIKGHVFGTKKPIVCVPVVERTTEEIITTIRNMTMEKVEMIEWRMDWYENVSDENAVKALLEKVSAYLKDTVFLCTFRSRKQGGVSELTREGYLSLNRMVAQTGIPDLVDLEYYELDCPKQVVEQIRQTGVKVICSNHNFYETPAIETIRQQLTDMVASGADFAKLAVMPKGEKDVLRLIEAVIQVKEKYPDSHLIAMSMGQVGVISRLLGGWFHSEVTFASFGNASAPGQVPYPVIKDILKQMEKCMRE